MTDTYRLPIKPLQVFWRNVDPQQKRAWSIHLNLTLVIILYSLPLDGCCDRGTFHAPPNKINAVRVDHIIALS